MPPPPQAVSGVSSMKGTELGNAKFEKCSAVSAGNKCIRVGVKNERSQFYLTVK